MQDTPSALVHPALKSQKLNSLPDDLKDLAKNLVAKKFGLPLEGEVVDKPQTTSSSPEIIFPKIMRQEGSYDGTICCGHCGWHWQRVRLQPMQNMRMGVDMGYASASEAAYYTQQQIQQQYADFYCPNCHKQNRGAVYLT